MPAPFSPMRRLLVCCVFIVSLAFVQDAEAFIYSWGGEEISVVEEYPDGDDACVIYEQIWVLWIPLWNSNARYVLGSKGSDQYFEFANTSDKQEVISEHGEASSAIPFWDKIGGKLLFAAILFFWFGRGSSKEDEGSDEEEIT